MAITNAQIRDLLNRPRGLNEGTISEYVTIRTAQINKEARSGTLYGVDPTNAVDTDLKETAIKYLVAVDCLRVLIDTMPSYVPENEFRQQDIRLNAQLRTMQRQADDMLEMVRAKGGTAFYVDKTNTRTE